MTISVAMLTIAYTQSIPRRAVPELVFCSNKLPKVGRCGIKKAINSPKQGNAEDSLSHHSDNNNGELDLKQFDCQDLATISLDAMEQANPVLEDIISFLGSGLGRSYFMFHEMDADSAESIFKWLPVLSFTETYIYQCDNINEKILQSPSGELPDFGRRPDLVTHPFKPLAILLESRGLLTDRIRDELKRGETFWALERKLCSALKRKEEIQLEDVIKAMHLRYTDYRILNLLLYRLTGKEVNEMHMQFISISEFLGEIYDDLIDYENDVLEGTFNTLRMFVGIYGATQAPTFLAKTIAEAEEEYKYLLNTLDPQIAFKFKKIREEAVKKAGKGTSIGTWSIPHVIHDEDLWKTNNKFGSS